MWNAWTFLLPPWAVDTWYALIIPLLLVGGKKLALFFSILNIPHNTQRSFQTHFCTDFSVLRSKEDTAGKRNCAQQEPGSF